jgi:AcrR family transcriptional regulator
MGEGPSLQDTIVQEAGALFREQGYTATTIKQIAKAAGCTTAALYYYFEDGKRHILGEVIRRSAQGAEEDRTLPGADSLEAFLVKLGAELDERFPRMADRFNWVILQFASLPAEEKAIVQQQVLGTHAALQERMAEYVGHGQQAERLAWLVFCAFLGFQQLFTKLEVGRLANLGTAEYSQFMGQIVVQGLAGQFAAADKEDGQ